SGYTRGLFGAVGNPCGRSRSGGAMADELVAPRWSVAPYLIVYDVVTTAHFYRDKLGFHYDRFWNDPPAFCMVKRNGVVIMLAQVEDSGVMRPNHIVDPEGGAWDAY